MADEVSRVGKANKEKKDKRAKEEEAKNRKEREKAQRANQVARPAGWRSNWMVQMFLMRMRGLWWKLALGTILFLAIFAVVRRNLAWLYR